MFFWIIPSTTFSLCLSVCLICLYIRSSSCLQNIVTIATLRLPIPTYRLTKNPNKYRLPTGDGPKSIHSTAAEESMKNLSGGRHVLVGRSWLNGEFNSYLKNGKHAPCRCAKGMNVVVLDRLIWWSLETRFQYHIPKCLLYWPPLYVFLSLLLPAQSSIHFSNKTMELQIMSG